MFSKFSFAQQNSLKRIIYKYNIRLIVDFDPAKDYYKILGIISKSSDKDIKIAYHKLAKQYHPDLNKGKSYDNFKEMSAAYDILSDPVKRKEYDEYRMLLNENMNERQDHFHENNRQNYYNEVPKNWNSHNRTTFTFRDKKTGQFKTYTYYDNPTFNGDYMKKAPQNREANENNFDGTKNNYGPYRNQNSRQQFQHRWDPNLDQDFYSYIFARKIFKYFLVLTIFLFILNWRKRRQNYHNINNPEEFPSIILTPYPQIMVERHPQNNKPFSTIPPEYNKTTYVYNRDPYTNQYINPKIK